MSVIKATTMDLSKLTFSDLKQDNNQRKMVFVNLNGGKVIIQTPLMSVPNGVKRWRKADSKDNRDDSFEMELSFGGDNPEIKKFHDKMLQFDELVKTQIMAHSKEWLGKPKVSMELIENAFYAPCVKNAMDKEGNLLDYPARIRAKLDRERINGGEDFSGRFLSYKKNATPILMFDENKKPLDMDESNFETIVPKGSHVVAVLELVYLTITTKVSAKWKLVQAKVTRSQSNISGYAMIDDDEQPQEQDDLDSETPVAVVTKAVEVVKLEDSDSEEDELTPKANSEDVVQDDLDSESEEEEVVVEVAKPKSRGRKAV